MKLKLTKTAKQELKVINAKMANVDYENGVDESVIYDSLSERELLATDAELYVEGAYEDNEFDNLEEWCVNVGQSEYDPKHLKKHPNAVFEKVTKMINEGLLVVAK